MYCIDTNIFLDWWARRYPPDVFPSVQVQIEALITNGKCIAPERVKDELMHVGPKPLQAWMKKQAGLFCPHDIALQTEANRIQTAYPGMIDPYAIHDEADRYLIALAKLRGWTVVTHETPAKTKKRPPRLHYIPDVCRAEKVPCIELVELMRREKWSF
jgi:hypothetical protein